MGLPIARQLIESHNGAIWCDSEINKGSRFYFVIPIANDKSNFIMLKKQLIQKARSNGTTVAIINIKSTSEAINNLLAEENLLNKAYMSNSLLENDGKNSTLSMIVMDGDKPSAEFLRRKIDALVDAILSQEVADYVKTKYNGAITCDSSSQIDLRNK